MFDVDQREVSILARKYCQDIKRGNVPMILFNSIVTLDTSVVSFAFFYCSMYSKFGGLKITIHMYP